MSRVTAPTIRFTVEEFERMVDADVFGTTRVELINGRIYRMAAQKDPHQFSSAMTHRALGVHVPPDEMLLAPGTLQLDDLTLVDPDLIWIPAPFRTPMLTWPKPIVLVEASETTYRKDSGIKLRKYARAGVPEYWIINLKALRIEVYRDPVGPTGRLADCAYRDVSHRVAGETIALLRRPDVRIDVGDCLP